MERLQIHVPEGLSSEMVTEYVNRCQRSLIALNDALERSDYEHARVFGHRLAGTGGAYGIPRLTDIGAAIEHAAVRKEMGQLRRQADATRTCLSAVEVLPD